MSRRADTCRTACVTRGRAGIVTNEPRVFSEGMGVLKGRRFLAQAYCDRPECLPYRSAEVTEYTGEPAQSMPDDVARLIVGES